MPLREQRIFDPRDPREISLAASFTHAERRIVLGHDEDRPDFREMRRTMLSNRGVL